MIQGNCVGKKTGRPYKYIILERSRECKAFLYSVGFLKVKFCTDGIFLETSRISKFNVAVSITPEEERMLIVIVFDTISNVTVEQSYPHFIEGKTAFFELYESDLKEAFSKI